MKQVFVDTGGFFAALDADDRHHAQARQLFVDARSERWLLLTTNAVVYETHALLTTRTSDRRVALAFLELIDHGLCEVHRVGVQDERGALDILRTHSDKGYSYCDALSFAVMESRRVTEAIAFDRHFREYGRWVLL